MVTSSPSHPGGTPTSASSSPHHNPAAGSGRNNSESKKRKSYTAENTDPSVHLINLLAATSSTVSAERQISSSSSVTSEDSGQGSASIVSSGRRRASRTTSLSPKILEEVGSAVTGDNIETQSITTNEDITPHNSTSSQRTHGSPAKLELSKVEEDVESFSRPVRAESPIATADQKAAETGLNSPTLLADIHGSHKKARFSDVNSPNSYNRQRSYTFSTADDYYGTKQAAAAATRSLDPLSWLATIAVEEDVARSLFELGGSTGSTAAISSFPAFGNNSSSSVAKNLGDDTTESPTEGLSKVSYLEAYRKKFHTGFANEPTGGLDVLTSSAGMLASPVTQRSLAGEGISRISPTNISNTRSYINAATYPLKSTEGLSSSGAYYYPLDLSDLSEAQRRYRSKMKSFEEAEEEDEKDDDQDADGRRRSNSGVGQGDEYEYEEGDDDYEGMAEDPYNMTYRYQTYSNNNKINSSSSFIDFSKARSDAHYLDTIESDLQNMPSAPNPIGLDFMGMHARPRSSSMSVIEGKQYMSSMGGMTGSPGLTDAQALAKLRGECRVESYFFILI
jgi:hypothetical protein